ncbi:chlorophyllase [Dactylosporangium sp. NPDC005555]|uniref:alpha/beta hydrolase family protein n=1 Tax=Dactylosporangium sp. NPDC005555 TaxID=3154889 RepID=UPI0033A150DA
MSLLAAALLLLGGAFSASGADTPSEPLTAAAGAQAAGASSHAIGVRHFDLARGKDRPLPTTVWYPTRGSARRTKGQAQRDAAPLPGKLPLIVWSHGFYSNPQMQEGMTKFLAESGYVVVAAAYPFTKKDTPKFNKLDVPNQSLDASFVITQMLQPGNPLADSIDPGRMAAVGHSGGGTTTDGLFTVHRDPRLRAGVIFAGRPAGKYQGSPVPLLFIHGDKDPVVAYEQGRTSYAANPWPKAFLTIIGGEHGAGTNDAERGHHQAMATLLDFLTWALDGDDSARLRLSNDATLDGVTRFESVGIYSTSTSTTTTTTTATTAAPTMRPSLEPVAAG